MHVHTVQVTVQVLWLLEVDLISLKSYFYLKQNHMDTRV